MPEPKRTPSITLRSPSSLLSSPALVQGVHLL